MIWDKDSVKFLEKYYNFIPAKELAHILDTTVYSVKKKAYRNNFHKIDRGKTGPLSPCWKGVGLLNSNYLSKYKRDAKRKNREFKLTLEELYKLILKQKCRCALTGVLLFFDSKRGMHDGTASLDRIDSNKGYTIDNVQWVEKDINRSKSTFHDEKYKKLCSRVHLYNLSA